MATMPQSGKKYSEKKISYVVVQKAIAVRIVQPKHNWKKGENTELLQLLLQSFFKSRIFLEKSR